MLLFLDSVPEALAREPGPWDAIVGCSMDGRMLYAVAAFKLAGGAPMLEVKFSGVTPSKFRAFRDKDLPEIRALARRLYPGHDKVTSVCSTMDRWFYRLTKAMGWVGHGQFAILEV